MLKKIIFLFILLIPLVSLLAQEEESPYVLVVSLDGFRWDYLDRNISPNLKRMEESGVRALTFQPVFPSKTFPNHYSIVTGLYPQNHGIVNNQFVDIDSGERYFFKDSVSARDEKWYHGTSIWEKLQQSGIKTASFFWPGSEVKKGSKHPTYFKKFNKSIPHKDRVDGIINWLQLPEEKRPHLLFLYFCDTDTKGHLFGTQSAEMNQAITFLDKQIGYLYQRLKEINMLHKMNIIVLSDHGMTDLSVQKRVDLADIVEKNDLVVSGKSPVISLYVKKGGDKKKIFSEFKERENGFTVYQKDDIPPYFHYSESKYIGDMLIVANGGYTIFVKKRLPGFKFKKKGDHGYDNHLLDMQGIFLAEGPSFKRNYRIGQLRNIDIFPLICRIFNVKQSQNIDGNVDHIEFILK